MPVPNIFANVTTAIPLSQLDNNFATPITIGNTAVQLGNTVTTLNNMTLANVTINSVASTFPNSYLANNSVTIGNTAVSLGSTASSLGNLTLTNVTISSGNSTVSSESISGNLTFTGTGSRILGDFTNATITNRTSFQTSTANSSTGIYALPSGTSTAASWQATNAADPTNASKILIATNGSTDVQLVSGRNGTGTYLPLTFYTNGSEQMRLDTSGNVGIGTSSPTQKLAINSANTSTNSLLEFKQGDVTQGYAGFGGDNLLRLEASARPAGVVAGGANFIFFTTNGSERARIDSSGNLLVGTTSNPGVLAINGSTTNVIASFYNNNASSPIGINIYYGGTTPNNTTNDFITCNDTSAVRLKVRSNGGIANFSANNVNLSDRREKTNFAPAGEYLSKICAIPVQTFNYIDQNLEEDGGLTLGVVAQDVQAVAPELVMESNWGTEEEPKMRLSIYQTDLQYALMKCIQEQQAMIVSLQSEIELLKTKVNA